MFPLIVVALMNLPLQVTLYLDGSTVWPAQPIPDDSEGNAIPNAPAIIPPTRRAVPVDPSSFNVPFTPPWTPDFNPAAPIPACKCEIPERIERRT
jgi:hypothetical protein